MTMLRSSAALLNFGYNLAQETQNWAPKSQRPSLLPAPHAAFHVTLPS
jgi:hypothetical protein